MDVDLTRFLEAASVELAMQIIIEHNAAVVRCSCFSCVANSFNGSNTDAAHNGRCKLRDAIIELLWKHGLSMYNLFEHRDVKHVSHTDFKKTGGSNNGRIQSVQTFPETDAHIVEMYRAPGETETFSEYRESENRWRIAGFGERICSATALGDQEVKRWREFVMGLYDVRKSAFMVSTYGVLSSLVSVLWPALECD